eukprot:gene46-68_t
MRFVDAWSRRATLLVALVLSSLPASTAQSCADGAAFQTFTTGASCSANGASDFLNSDCLNLVDERNAYNQSNPMHLPSHCVYAGDAPIDDAAECLAWANENRPSSEYTQINEEANLPGCFEIGADVYYNSHPGATHSCGDGSSICVCKCLTPAPTPAPTPPPTPAPTPPPTPAPTPPPTCASDSSYNPLITSGTCAEAGFAPIADAAECQAWVNKQNASAIMDVDVWSTAVYSMDRSDAIPGCVDQSGSLNVVFNHDVNATATCDHQGSTCVCKCPPTPAPTTAPPFPFPPPPPLPPPPPSPPPFPVPLLGIPASPPPFVVTNEIAINHFEITFEGIDPYEMLMYPKVRQDFDAAYKNTLVTYLPGMTEPQITITKFTGNTTVKSVTLSNRIVYYAGTDFAITPNQTIAWLSSGAALTRFNQTLYPFGTDYGRYVSSIQLVKGQAIVTQLEIDEDDTSLTLYQILHANFEQTDPDFAFVKDMSGVQRIVNERWKLGDHHEFVMVPSLVDSMAQLVPTFADGRLLDPIESSDMAYTCTNATLDMGQLLDHTLCFLACAINPNCEWTSFEIHSKRCVGGTVGCTMDTLINATRPQRVGIKLRDERVVVDGEEMHDGALLSALAAVYRPFMGRIPESASRKKLLGTRRLLQSGGCANWEYAELVDTATCEDVGLETILDAGTCAAALESLSIPYAAALPEKVDSTSHAAGCILDPYERLFNFATNEGAVHSDCGGPTGDHKCLCKCPTRSCATDSTYNPVVSNEFDTCYEAGFAPIVDQAECQAWADGQNASAPAIVVLDALDGIPGCHILNNVVTYNSQTKATGTCGSDGDNCVCKCSSYEMKGLSCLLSDESGASRDTVEPCGWQPVLGMADASYQHSSTGVGNVYELVSTRVESLFPGDRVCPGVGYMKGISLAQESGSYKMSSCASYLSNDLQASFAVMAWSDISDDSTAACYLLPTCGSVNSPMTTYEEEFGEQSSEVTHKVAVLVKDAMLRPSAIDADLTEALSLATLASNVGSQLYTDMLTRAGDSSFSATEDCLLNHHALYDSSERGASSVCLPQNCSIWGTHPAYRSADRFFEDTCSTSDTACCASAHGGAAPCEVGPKTTACLAEKVGDIQLAYSEIEYFEIVDTFVVPNSEFMQRKRAESETLKHTESERMIPTCTIKLDVYSDDSYSLEAKSVTVLRAENEPNTTDAMHVSRTCPLMRADPRYNELVVSKGKSSTHVSRATESAGPLRVSLMSSLMPYSSKVHIPLSVAHIDFGNMINRTSNRGTGLLDPHRPSDVVWRAADSDERRATYAVPGTAVNEDGISFGDAFETPHHPPYNVYPRMNYSASGGVAGRFEVSRRVMKARSDDDGVTLCFALCQSDSAFRIASKFDSSLGVDNGYFTSEQAMLENNVADDDIESLAIGGVSYFYSSSNSVICTGTCSGASDYDDMHSPRESDALILEVREATGDADHQRVTFRTLDKQNAVRQGAVCVRNVPLKFDKTYDVTIQTFKSGAASDYSEPLCSESAADEQTSATIDYLTGSSAGEKAKILTSEYPSISLKPEEATMEYHDASEFAVEELGDALFDEELRHIEMISETSGQMRHLLSTLCDDISFSSSEPEFGSSLPACLGFTFRTRMNPQKVITQGSADTQSTYGDFCWKGHAALFNDLNDCESKYTSCQKSSIADYPVYDVYGNIESFDGTAGNLYHPMPTTELADFKSNVGRAGGATRSACATRKDHMIEFHDTKLYLSPSVDSSVLDPHLASLRSAASSSRRLLGNSLVDAAVADLVNVTIYNVSERRVADNAADRSTYLKRAMYTVVGNKLAQKMRNTSLYLHIDKITSQAFACGEPELATDYTTEGGVYDDVYTMNFTWNNVIEVNGEDVVDSEIKFAFGSTQESATTHMSDDDANIAKGSYDDVRPYSFASVCKTDVGSVSSGYEAYSKTSRVCSTSKSMTWMTNPREASYTDPRTPDSDSDSVCENEPMHISFTGKLRDFLDLTNRVAPDYMLREDHAGAYTHKTQLLMRQVLHLRTGNTVQRDFFYPVYIKTLSNQIMTFSAQSAVLPSAISRLTGVTVQYDHATLKTVIEANVNVCVSQPAGTLSERQYELVNPIYGYDHATLNPSYSKSLRLLGTPKYVKLSDEVTPTPGAVAEIYLMNADDDTFDAASYSGVNDQRFDAQSVVGCVLIQQTGGEQQVPGSDSRFSTDETLAQAYQHFEFNCFDRVYVCTYDNNEEATSVHLRLGSSYIVRSGNLFTVDPLNPESIVHATTVSMTVASESVSQSFDIAMKIDVPKALQDTAALPTWSAFHAESSEGLNALHQLVEGTGVVSNRVEPEQRFRVTAHLSTATMRDEYVLYPISLFAVLKMKNSVTDTLQSSGPLRSDGTSISEPRTDFCGFSANMAKGEEVLEDVGKIVPIYQGIFQRSRGVQDDSFVNPSALHLSEFQREGVVDSKLLALLQSRDLYVSDSLQSDMMPTREKGGLDMHTSSNSWTLVNNIVVPNTDANLTFEVNFCYIGAVVTKQDAVGSAAARSGDGADPSGGLSSYPNYIESTASKCSSFASAVGASGFSGTNDESLPHGCIVLIDSQTVYFNTATKITTAPSPGTNTQLLCLVPGTDTGHAYGTVGLTCAESVFRQALTKEACLAKYGGDGSTVTVVNNANLPYGCVRTSDLKMKFNEYVSEASCSSQDLCDCERAIGPSGAMQETPVQVGYCLPPEQGGNRRRLLGYAFGSVGSTSARTLSGTGDETGTGNVGVEHQVDLVAIPRGTSSSTADAVVTVDGDTVAEVHTVESTEHDDHDSSKYRIFISVIISLLGLVFILASIILVAKIRNTIKTNGSGNTDPTKPLLTRENSATKTRGGATKRPSRKQAVEV